MASNSMLKSLMLILTFCFILPSPSYAHRFPGYKIDSIYQFGDSISDTGNLINEPHGALSNFARLPYGMTLFHKPTGRCSDGLLMIDYFAKFFKLPFLDAYLNKDGNFAHGVNFAVAGSTALNTSTLAAKNIMSPITDSSLSVQLDWFRTHLKSVCSNPSECKHKLAKALFIIETGGNDFNYAFFQRKSMEEVQLMVDEVIQAITKAVKDVVELGATRVVIPGNFPIGCMPIYLSAFEEKDPAKYDELHCLKDLNGFAMFQNDRLQQALKEVQEQYPKVVIVYGDYYNALKYLLQRSTSHGFEKDNVQRTCCGHGDNEYNFNMTMMCGSKGVAVCSNPEKRVSWDGVHMTQAAYKVLANWLLKTIRPRISFKLKP